MKKKLSLMLVCCVLLLSVPLSASTAHWADEFIDYGKAYGYGSSNIILVINGDNGIIVETPHNGKLLASVRLPLPERLQTNCC